MYTNSLAFVQYTVYQLTNNTLHMFYHVICQLTHTIPVDVPYNRWDMEVANPSAATMSARFGGFVAAIDSFDAALFGIKAAEAVLMDPQQRLLLMHTYQVSTYTMPGIPLTTALWAALQK